MTGDGSLPKRRPTTGPDPRRVSVAYAHPILVEKQENQLNNTLFPSNVPLIYVIRSPLSVGAGSGPAAI